MMYGIDCSTILFLMDYKWSMDQNNIMKKLPNIMKKWLSWHGELGYIKLSYGELKAIYFFNILTE